MKGYVMGHLGFRLDDKRAIGTKNIVPLDFRHSLIVGATGSGKTASVIRPNILDRMKRGYGMLIYTYKGHEHKYIKHIAKEQGRLEDVVEVAKPHGVFINLLDILNEKSIDAIVKDHAGFSKDPYWAISSSSWIKAVIKVYNGVYNQYKIIEKYGLFNEFDIDFSDYSSFAPYPKKPTFEKIVNIFASIDKFKEFRKDVLEFQSLIRRKTNSAVKGYYKENVLFASDSNTISKIKALQVEDEMERIYKSLAIELYNIRSSIKTIKDISFAEDPPTNSGNNGVLQIAYNALFDLGNKKYLNTSDANIEELLEDRKIVIIDIDSLDDVAHSVMIKSVLKACKKS
jgi:hypothetical protein